MSKKKKKKTGRRGKFHEWLKPEGLTTLEGWARDGLTDEQIASNIGIAPSTLYEWKLKYPEFAEALKRGKVVVDIEVENALLKRALGYEYEEVKTYMEDTDGKKRKRVEKLQKHEPANVTAIIFWLKNRRPEQWKDKQNIEHTGKDGGAIETKNGLDLSALSDKELTQLEEIVEKHSKLEEPND